ncbi:hypothetical protein GBA52_028492, partial [Prunus armeniaca]
SVKSRAQRKWGGGGSEAGLPLAAQQAPQNCLDCEIRFLSSVCHPNIVRLLKAFQVFT